MPTLLPYQLAEWTTGHWEQVPGSPLPTCITGIVHDSRELKPGHAFLAIRGERHDGHRFLAEVARRGAVCAIVDSAWQRTGDDPSFPVLRVDNTHTALSALALGYRNQVKPVMVGVTGSAGKSTAKEMTAQLLARRYKTARTRGNWNNDIGLPLSILAMEPDTTHGVFEVGMNHPGEIEALCKTLIPDQAIVTNVAPVHIANFGSVEGIAHEKGALLRALPASGRAFLNSDLACFDQLSAYCACPITTVGTSNKGDYHVDHISPDGVATVHERSSGIRMSIRLPVPGQHNLANAMMALAVARHNGMEIPEIEDGLAQFEPMPMRWQIHHVAGATLINDAYNANPLSMRAAISTFMTQPARSRWLVIGGMLELGEHEAAEHRSLGTFIGTEARPDHLLVVGALGTSVGDAALTAGMSATHIEAFADADTAGRALLSRLEPGTSILLKASRGFHFETIVQHLTGTETHHG